jgi:hypothetical protein
MAVFDEHLILDILGYLLFLLACCTIILHFIYANTAEYFRFCRLTFSSSTLLLGASALRLSLVCMTCPSVFYICITLHHIYITFFSFACLQWQGPELGRLGYIYSIYDI